MEYQENLVIFPKRFGSTRIVFTPAQMQEIQQDLIAGVKTTLLYKKWGLTTSAIQYFIKKYMHSGDLELSMFNFKEDTVGRKPLGHKTVPYFLTEKEIEKDLDLANTFTWDSLSELEKTFYATYYDKKRIQKSSQKTNSFL
jgi:hypothetical protein